MSESRELAEGVRRLGLDDVDAVVEVLVQSFYDYPVMRFVLERDPAGREGVSSIGSDYGSEPRELVHFFVMARMHRNEVVLGLGSTRDLQAVALVSRPDGPPSPPQLGQLRERLWLQLGASARARYEAFGAACAPFQVEAPHLHLNMVGVRPVAQGRGLGRRVIEAVHRLAAEDAEAEGVSLSTEDEKNVPFYQHLGYRILGRADVAPALTTWAFYRADT